MSAIFSTLPSRFDLTVLLEATTWPLCHHHSPQQWLSLTELVMTGYQACT